MSERDIQKSIRLKHSKGRCRLFNNDNGMATLQDGKKITYGLAKSSPDLIGWLTVKITPEMVGKDVAIFCGIEVKMPRKHPTSEQRRFLELLESVGAITGVARSENDIDFLFDTWMERMTK